MYEESRIKCGGWISRKVSNCSNKTQNISTKKNSGTQNGGILYLMLGSFGGGKTPTNLKRYPYSLLWVRIPPFSVPEIFEWRFGT